MKVDEEKLKIMISQFISGKEMSVEDVRILLGISSEELTEELEIIDVKELRRTISEDIFQNNLLYKKFYGKIVFPDISDFLLVHRIQNELMKIRKPNAFADLLIVSICVNRDEVLDLKVKIG